MTATVTDAHVDLAIEAAVESERRAPLLDRDAFVDAVAQAIADAEERGRQRGVQPFRDLFSGGPDTSCRTTWRTVPGGEDVPTDCVEVPLDDLRAAFVEAGDPES